MPSDPKLVEPLVGNEDVAIDFIGEDSDLKLGCDSYRTHLRLALSAGFVVAFFFIPVCSENAHVKLFTKGDTNMTHPYWGTISDVTTKTNYTITGLDLQGMLIAPDIISYWPNVVQFAFFSLSPNFGSTMPNVVEGFYGTFLASVNVVVMAHFFPVGGKCTLKKEVSFGLRIPCETYEDPNYEQYGWMVAWFDTLLVICLALGSTHSISVKKWVLSWHIGYMMAFMSPAGYVFSNSVMATTIIGGIMALLVMFNKRIAPTARDWPKKIAKEVKHVMKEATRLMKMESRNRYEGFPQVWSLVVCQKIDEVNQYFAQMMGNLGEAWWECVLFRNLSESNKRGYYFAQVFEFNDTTASSSGLDDFLYLVRQCVSRREGEVGDDNGDKMLQALSTYIDDVCTSSTDLLEEVARWAAVDVAYDPTSLKEKLDLCITRKKTLIKQYRKASEQRDLSLPGCSLHGYVYALTCISEKVEIAAKGLNDQSAFKESKDETTAIPVFIAYMKRTYDSSILDRDYLDRWFRDTFVIGFAFIAGYWLNGSVFTAFNPYMASTLSLLLIPGGNPGSNLFKNVNRLLGVSLGKSLTILLMAVIALFGDTGFLPVIAHLLGVFAFISYFGYVYFCNGFWAYPCMLVAGFGCYTLVGIHPSDWWSNAIFVTRYKEIGQFTWAIVFRTLVDSADTLMRGKLPRDQVTNEMKQLGYNLDSKTIKVGLISEVLRFYFDISSYAEEERETGKQKMLNAIKGHISHLQDLVPACGPHTILSESWHKPFECEVFEAALSCIETITQQIDLLFAVEGMKSWDSSPFEQLLDQMEKKREHLQETLKFTFMSLQMVLQKKDDGVVARSLKGTQKSVHKFYEKAKKDPSIRLRVMDQVVNNMVDECLKLQAVMLASGSLTLEKVEYA